MFDTASYVWHVNAELTSEAQELPGGGSNLRSWLRATATIKQISTVGM